MFRYECTSELSRRQLILGAVGSTGFILLPGIPVPSSLARPAPGTCVPIGAPEICHIPYFAMPAEGATASGKVRINDLAVLREELGKKAVTWLHDTLGEQFRGLYLTREYVPPRTAQYQLWIEFANERAAGQFLGYLQNDQSSLCKDSSV